MGLCQTCHEYKKSLGCSLQNVSGCSGYVPNTIKKRCLNCKHNRGYFNKTSPCIHCHADVGGYAHWEWNGTKQDKQEDIMKKRLELTEDQFNYLCDEFFPVDKEMKEQIRQQMRDHCVLPPDPVEESETMYLEFKNACAENSSRSDAIKVMEKLYTAVQYLKGKVNE